MKFKCAVEIQWIVEMLVGEIIVKLYKLYSHMLIMNLHIPIVIIQALLVKV